MVFLLILFPEVIIYPLRWIAEYDAPLMPNIISVLMGK
jgi:hypothetical protein